MLQSDYAEPQLKEHSHESVSTTAGLCLPTLQGLYPGFCHSKLTLDFTGGTKKQWYFFPCFLVKFNIYC